MKLAPEGSEGSNKSEDAKDSKDFRCLTKNDDHATKGTQIYNFCK